MKKEINLNFGGCLGCVLVPIYIIIFIIGCRMLANIWNGVPINLNDFVTW